MLSRSSPRITWLMPISWSSTALARWKVGDPSPRRITKSSNDSLGKLTWPAHDVVHDSGALVGATEPHHHTRPVGHVAVAGPSVVAGRQPGRLAPLLDLGPGEVAVVGGAVGQQLLDGGRVRVGALGLEVGPRVPVEAQPPQGLDDGVHVLLGLQRGVGVLHSQHHLTTVMPGEQPVEQRRPGAPHMQEPRRRGRKPNPGRTHTARLAEALRGFCGTLCVVQAPSSCAEAPCYRRRVRQ